MAIDYPIYEDGVIAVKLSAENASKEQYGLFHISIRYLEPIDTKDKNDNVNKTTNIVGGETDWFILPASFGYAIAKSLIEQKIAGLDCFYENGFNRMIHLVNRYGRDKRLYGVLTFCVTNAPF